jgi:photosystem II stability/assembly factor-like uncharacterized protein
MRKGGTYLTLQGQAASEDSPLPIPLTVAGLSMYMPQLKWAASWYPLMLAEIGSWSREAMGHLIFPVTLGIMIHPDVHSISVHPKSTQILTASTGGGLYRSVDGGKTWQNIYACYIRAAWVDPDDPLHIIAGPADGVSRNGRIEQTFDGGKSWHPSAEGIAAPWERHMVERIFQKGSYLFAILSNGEIWMYQLNQARWTHILKDIGHVEAMAAM